MVTPSMRRTVHLERPNGIETVRLCIATAAHEPRSQGCGELMAPTAKSPTKPRRSGMYHSSLSAPLPRRAERQSSRFARLLPSSSRMKPSRWSYRRRSPRCSCAILPQLRGFEKVKPSPGCSPGSSRAGWVRGGLAGQGGLGWVRGEVGGSEAPAGASGGRNERPPDPGAPGPGTGPSAAAGAAPAGRVRQRVGLVLEGGVADHDLVAGLGAGLRQQVVDAGAAQAPLEVLHRLGVVQVGHGHPAGRTVAEDAPATLFAHDLDRRLRLRHGGGVLRPLGGLLGALRGSSAGDGVGDRVQQCRHALAGGRRDREEGQLAAGGGRLGLGQARPPLWQVDLVAGDQRRTGRQVRVVGLQLGLQRRQVALGVAALLDRHEVENVHQHGGARQVAQEAVAEALALGGPRDQARNVGEHEVAAVHAHHPEHRLQRGEGVVGDLGAGGGGARHDARLAGVGEADQADVGEQPQLQPQAALLPGLAALVEVRDAPAGRQGGVAAPAAPAPGGHEAGAGGGEIGEQAAILVADHGADRHGQEAVGAVGALAVVALAVGALAGALVRVEVVLDQGRHAGVGRQYHVPAVTAVATVRPTPGPVLLTVERGDPVAPATCRHLESGLVYEHRPPAPRPGDGLLALLYAGELAAADLVVDDPAGDLGEQGVVAATADAGAGVDARAALAHQDRAGGDDLAAEPLHAQALGRGVTAVAAGRGAFLVGHLGSALLLLLSGLLARGAALGAKLDALDLEPGQELTVALVALLAGLVLVGVDQHLLAAVLGDHGGGHGRLREVVGGDGDLAPVLDHEQWLELEAGAVVTGEPLDVDDV